MQDFTSVENLREKRAEALNLTLFEFILFNPSLEGAWDND